MRQNDFYKLNKDKGGKLNSVYIIVVTYNAESWLPFFTKHFSKLPEGWQLVVVDNASTDNTCQVITKQYMWNCMVVN